MGLDQLKEAVDYLELLLDVEVTDASSEWPNPRLCEAALQDARELQKLLQHLMEAPKSSMHTFLLAGAQLMSVARVRNSLKETVSTILADMPLTDDTKASLEGAQAEVLAYNLASEEQQQEHAAASLHSLYEDAVSKKRDAEAVEVAIDAVMKQLIKRMFGCDKLGAEELQREVGELEQASQERGSAAGSILLLALNSLQRLHAFIIPTEDQSAEDEAEDDDEDEDEDDPFFMPLPFAALKMADEKRFASLAQPISATPLDGVGAVQPIIELDDSDSGPGSATSLQSSSPAASPIKVLTDEDFEPLTEEHTSRPSARPFINLPMGRSSASGVAAPASDPMSTGQHDARANILWPVDLAPAAAPLSDIVHQDSQDRSSKATTITTHDSAPLPADAAAAAAHEQQNSAITTSIAHAPEVEPAPAKDVAVEKPAINVPTQAAATAEITAAAMPVAHTDRASGQQRQIQPVAGQAVQAPVISEQRHSAPKRTSSNGTKATRSVRPSADGRPPMPPASQTGPGAAAGPDAAAIAKPARLSGSGDEKHTQFVSFLQGQNPGACMFHAQMRLTADGCRKLALFLKSSSRVRALSLSHNFIGEEGVAVLCEGLRQNTSVNTVDLPHNNITDQAVVMLSKALAHNHSLTQLQLANNQIGDAGAAALAELIKANHSIKKLGLAHNQIGKAGCQALASAIKANCTLQQLQLLPGNPVEEKDAKALSKAMQSGKKFSIRNLLGL